MFRDLRTLSFIPTTIPPVVPISTPSFRKEGGRDSLSAVGVWVVSWLGSRRWFAQRGRLGLFRTSSTTWTGSFLAARSRREQVEELRPPRQCAAFSRSGAAERLVRPALASSR